MNWVDPLGLYEQDVHLDLTACLAKHAGFSAEHANVIAQANQAVDDDPRTAPMQIPSGPRRDWHFTTFEQREKLWDRALAAGLTELGQYLHAMQDSYAHADFGPTFGHVRKLTSPDKTYNNPELANSMARASYNRLIEYLSVQTGAPVPDRWDEIRDMVDRFNRAKTSADKQRYLSGCR